MATTVTHTCDRCGRNAHVVQNFKIQFNKMCMLGVTPLRDLQTGDLCIDCTEEWSERFFNRVVAWRRKGK